VLMLIPLLVVGLAVWVLTIAVRDERGRPKDSLPRLPNPNSHPLHHVRVSMVSTRRRAQAAARGVEAKPPTSGEVRRFHKRV
jgi:hypothetical protein